MALNKIIVVKETDNKISVGLPVTQETLDSVTDRGNVTNNSITVSGLTVNGAINVSGISASGITAVTASIGTITNSVVFNGNQVNASQANINQVNATGLLTTNINFTNATGSIITTTDLNAQTVDADDIVANTTESTLVNASSVVASSVTTNIVTPASGTSIAIQAAVVAGSGGTFTVNNDGSVQIGSSSPSVNLANPLLEIAHNSSVNQAIPTLRLTDTDNNVLANQVLGSVEFSTGDSGNAGVKASIRGVATDITPDGYLTFNTQGGGGASAPSERMRIDSSGNVGIGIVPSVRLHVSGDAIISGNVSATTANANAINSTTLVVVNASATTINASGITASGVTANSVSGSSFAGVSGSFNSVTASGLSSTSGTFSLVSSSVISSASGISVSGTSVFAGKVGIGTAVPTEALHVTGSALIEGGIDTNGNIKIEKINPRLRLRNTGGGDHSDGFDIHVQAARFFIDDNTHNLNILDFNFDSASSGHTLTMGSNKFVVATAPNGNYSPSSRVVVDGSGNVAIGVSGTTHKLHVSGSVRIDGQATETPPANTTVVNRWLLINIDGTTLRLPLYL
jgi:hypothetical protein